MIEKFGPLLRFITDQWTLLAFIGLLVFVAFILVNKQLNKKKTIINGDNNETKIEQKNINNDKKGM